MSTTPPRRLPSMVAYWDKDLRCRFANDAYELWFGVDPSSLVGVHMRDLLGVELFGRNERYIEGALNGNLQVFERTLRAPDSTLHDSLAHYVPDLIGGDVGGFSVQVSELSTSAGASLSERRQSKARRATDGAGPAPGVSQQVLLSARVRDALQGVHNASSLLRRQHDPGSLNRCLAVLDEACVRLPEVLTQLEAWQLAPTTLPSSRARAEPDFHECENGHLGVLWSPSGGQGAPEVGERVLALVREAPGRLGRGLVCGICGSAMHPCAAPSAD